MRGLALHARLDKEVTMETRIKVLEGIDSYLPDVDGVVNCMHNYCLNSYKKVELLAVAPKHSSSYVDELPYPIARCNSIYMPGLRLRYGNPMGDLKFRKEVMERDFDIVHIHSPFNMAKFAHKVAVKKNIPLVATFHTNFRPIVKSILMSEVITEAIVQQIGDIYNKCDEIFVCSPTVADQARSFGYTGKITYLPFGTEFAKAENTEDLKRKADEHFNLRPDELVFIFVGRIMPLKRIDFIIDALKILKERGHKFRFFVSGKGVYTDTLKKQASDLGFTGEQINFLGFIDRDIFPALYARADLLLFPSLYDNFGLVKVEAAAFSTAGVFVKDSAAGYGIVDGHNGFLSDDSVEAFAERVEAAIADRGALRQVGINASNELYISWEQCTDLLIKRYREIIGEWKPREKVEL